jgi:hypothetical protein
MALPFGQSFRTASVVMGQVGAVLNWGQPDSP